MKNSNNFITSILIFIGIQSASAGQGIIFDNPGLISVDIDGVVTGYYDAADEKRECAFLFVQKKGEAKEVDPYSEVKLLTFIPSENDFKFSARDKSFDIGGELYRRDDTWLIRTDTGQAGCENALGVFMSLPAGKVGGAIFSVQKRIPAKGIRLVKQKSFFYDLRDGEFIARKGYLTKWNGVIVLQTSNEFSYVRFADPRTNVPSAGRVTAGWVHSADLVNPFSPAARQ